MSQVIVTDVDGVMLNWDYAFDLWVRQEHKRIERGLDYLHTYDTSERYTSVSRGEARELILEFNHSAAIGFLPPLRDAVQYVKKLHERHGVVLHVITSLSKDQYAQRLRVLNLHKLFGDTVFDRFIFLDTGAPKQEVLEQYRGIDALWIEDKYANAVDGREVGLTPIMMEHGYNMHLKEKDDGVTVVKNWKDIYDTFYGD